VGAFGDLLIVVARGAQGFGLVPSPKRHFWRFVEGNPVGLFVIIAILGAAWLIFSA
jgi:hypothetical protein